MHHIKKDDAPDVEQKSKKSAGSRKKSKNSSKRKVAKLTSSQGVQGASNSLKRPSVNAPAPNRDRVKVSMKKHGSQLLTRNDAEPSPFNSKQERRVSVCKISASPEWQLPTESSCSLKETSNGECDEVKKTSFRHSRRFPLFPPVSIPLAYQQHVRQSRSGQVGEGRMRIGINIRTRQSGEEKNMLCPMKLSVVSLKLPNIA